MSEPLGLGESDAQSRWIGIRRHQAVAIMLGLGLVGDWVLRPRAALIEAVVGLGLLVSAVTVTEGLTLAELGVIAVRFVGRSRWTSVEVRVEEEMVSLDARGRSRFRGYALHHRGRLDLSGRDLDVASSLATVVDGLATAESDSHVSLHVAPGAAGVATLLSLNDTVTPPPGWTVDTSLALHVAGATPTRPDWLLERWPYVRTERGLVSVIRIRDFSSATGRTALLERLQGANEYVGVALHVEVLGGSRAQRTTERAVHRQRSDGAITLAAGFRRTARTERALERVGQREAQVARGRSLLRLAVYAVVGAASLKELRECTEQVVRTAHESGLRTERGFGRQARWYCQQLPGGPGW